MMLAVHWSLSLSPSHSLSLSPSPSLSLFPQDMMHYEQLKAGVIQHDMLVDNLIYKVFSLESFINYLFTTSEQSTSIFWAGHDDADQKHNLLLSHFCYYEWLIMYMLFILLW